MKKIQVLIIEDNQKLVELLKKHLNKFNIDVFLTANDGTSGLNLINEKKCIDVIILDLIMPRKDGLYILKNINNKRDYSKIIISTSNNSPDLIRRISSYGINNYLLKPYDLDLLVDRIKEIVSFKFNFFHTNDILLDFGIPPHLKGYKYLEIAINSLGEDFVNVTDIYKNIANIDNVTVSKVERSIRYAIEVGFSRANTGLIN